MEGIRNKNSQSASSGHARTLGQTASTHFISIVRSWIPTSEIPVMKL